MRLVAVLTFALLLSSCVSSPVAAFDERFTVATYPYKIDVVDRDKCDWRFYASEPKLETGNATVIRAERAVVAESCKENFTDYDSESAYKSPRGTILQDFALIINDVRKSVTIGRR